LEELHSIGQGSKSHTKKINKGLLGLINGNKIQPETGAEEQEKWDMVDSQAMILITNSLEPQLSETFCYYEMIA
jgi:hypothetical protein